MIRFESRVVIHHVVMCGGDRTLADMLADEKEIIPADTDRLAVNKHLDIFLAVPNILFNNQPWKAVLYGNTPFHICMFYLCFHVLTPSGLHLEIDPRGAK